MIIEIVQELLVSPFLWLREKWWKYAHGYVPILCLDFDGVLHSYISGWKGASIAVDPPVEGAIEWLDSLVEDGESVCSFAPRFREFDVCIYSARSSQWGGRRAMRSWLLRHGFPPDKIENIRFPLFKPPAQVSLDDRVITFTGKFPTVEELQQFTPWNKKTPEDV